ncbi:hypothetical protein KG112_08150 [Nocardioides sp. zg-ZUI104]|uniref:hypothetical protein n=1 Tax=Nocardioides faecalis TaxID=2803858 RepID=UPI001BCEC034|nr:hypothetical protein [Nocardioides faecalis]MBS4752778.1 hypothetical protein [Nocardioides faecalis]
MTAPRIVMLVGPSQIGKDSLIARLVDEHDFHYHVNATTRSPRQPAARSHAEYKFLTREQFHEEVRRGGFLDWDYFAGNYYGVTWPSGQEARAVMHCGARMSIRIAQRESHYVPVFLMPSDRSAHRARILSTFPADEAASRLAMMDEEFAHAALFQQVVEVPRYASTDDVLATVLALLPGDDGSESS